MHEPRFQRRLWRAAQLGVNELLMSFVPSLSPPAARSRVGRRHGSRSTKLLQCEHYPIIDCPMLSADQRRLLGEFVRAHRERAQPMESRGRRRTPGLRREELAAKPHQRDLVRVDRTRTSGSGVVRSVGSTVAGVVAVARRARLFVRAGRTFGSRYSARSECSDVLAGSCEHGSPSGLRSRPAVGCLLLEQGRGPAFSRLARRRPPAKSFALCVS